MPGFPVLFLLIHTCASFPVGTVAAAGVPASHRLPRNKEPETASSSSTHQSSSLNLQAASASDSITEEEMKPTQEVRLVPCQLELHFCSTGLSLYLCVFSPTNKHVVFPYTLLQWDAERYQQQHSFVWKYGSSLIDVVQELMQDDHSQGSASCNIRDKDSSTTTTPNMLRMLDVGCGSGELTQALADLVCGGPCVVHGMDADPKMIERARVQYPDLQFFVQDVRTLQHHALLGNDDDKEEDDDNKDNRYNVIFSNAALHWVPPEDAELMVQSLTQQLQPGGHLVVEFGGKGNVQSIVQATDMALKQVVMGGSNVQNQDEIMTSTTKDPDDTVPFVKPFWYFPSVGEFTSLLEQYGMEVSSASLFDRPTPLEEGTDGVANWLLMFGSKFFQGLQDWQVDRVLEKVQDQLRPTSMWNGRQWTADYRRIRVVAVKKDNST